VGTGPHRDVPFRPDGRTFRDVLQRFWEGGEPEQVFFRYPDAQ
jgi:hypothetical protein